MKIKEIKEKYFKKMKIGSVYLIKEHYRSNPKHEEFRSKKLKFLGFTGEILNLMLFEDVTNKTKVSYNMAEFEIRDKNKTPLVSMVEMG